MIMPAPTFKLNVTKHAADRVDEKITNIAPELKDLDRLKKLIMRSGKWFFGENEDDPEKGESYYCVINNLHVGVFVQEGNEMVLVTVYPFTQHFKRRLNHCAKVEVICSA